MRTSDLARTEGDQMARGLFRPSQARLVAGRLPLMSFADGALPVATTPRSGVITGQGWVVVVVVGYCNCAYVTSMVAGEGRGRIRTIHTTYLLCFFFS